MECLGCNYILTTPVTLRDGRIVCSSCEAWRIECEARHVLALPHRREYLDEIKKRRGEDAYQALRNEMLSLQDAARHAAEPLFDEV